MSYRALRQLRHHGIQDVLDEPVEVELDALDVIHVEDCTDTRRVRVPLRQVLNGDVCQECAEDVRNSTPLMRARSLAECLVLPGLLPRRRSFVRWSGIIHRAHLLGDAIDRIWAMDQARWLWPTGMPESARAARAALVSERTELLAELQDYHDVVLEYASARRAVHQVLSGELVAPSVTDELAQRWSWQVRRGVGVSQRRAGWQAACGRHALEQREDPRTLVQASLHDLAALEAALVGGPAQEHVIVSTTRREPSWVDAAGMLYGRCVQDDWQLVRLPRQVLELFQDELWERSPRWGTLADDVAWELACGLWQPGDPALPLAAPPQLAAAANALLV